jgi:hypothetical protein
VLGAVLCVAAAAAQLETVHPERIFVGDGWTDDDVEALDEGFAALPEALRQVPGGPLELELHSEPRPFGIGEWSADHRRLHLYAYADPAERRASWRLEHLSRDERARIWRRRAAVHAALTRWNDAKHFSDDTRWRALNGWLKPLERPMTWSERALNLSDAAYSRAIGKQSAALDLVTFAEEYFVPAPGLPVDDSLPCQEFSKSRVLSELLGLRPPSPSCPAFDEWADLGALDHLEVLLVQASGRRPESLFGHVLLLPVHHDAATVRGPSFESAVQLAAATETLGGIRHLWRGLTGGYRLSVMTLSQRDLERDMLEREQRSMRRFRLNLSAAQNRRVLERVWELERRGSFDYQFFTDNCGSALLWLLQGALGKGVQLRARGAVLVAPGAIVDDLAEAQLDGHALLAYVPDDFESSCERAQRADERRKQLEAELPRELHSAFAAARASDVGRRASGREAVAAFTRRTGASGLYEWWHLTVLVEQCSADLAERTLRETDLKRVRAGSAPALDVDGEVQAREDLFERESTLRRHLMLLDRAQKARDSLEALPRRPPTAGEQEELDHAQAQVDAFDALLDLHASLVQNDFPKEDPHALLAREHAALTAELTGQRNDAQPASGHWRASAGVGFWWSGAEGFRPALSLSSSGLLEELGDQRVRGFQSAVSMRVLDGEAVLLPRLGWPDVARSRFTLFGIKSLMRTPEWARDTPLADLGWGAELMTDTRRGRVLENRSGFSAELLALAAKTKHWAGHLVLGLGASGFVTWGDAAFGAAAGLYGTVAARAPLPGSGANGARLELKYQLLAHTGGKELWLEELDLQAGADVKAGPLLVSPRVVLAAQRQQGVLLPPSAGVTISFELLAAR